MYQISLYKITTGIKYSEIGTTGTTYSEVETPGISIPKVETRV